MDSASSAGSPSDDLQEEARSYRSELQQIEAASTVSKQAKKVCLTTYINQEQDCSLLRRSKIIDCLTQQAPVWLLQPAGMRPPLSPRAPAATSAARDLAPCPGLQALPPPRTIRAPRPGVAAAARARDPSPGPRPGAARARPEPGGWAPMQPRARARLALFPPPPLLDSPAGHHWIHQRSMQPAARKHAIFLFYANFFSK